MSRLSRGVSGGNTSEAVFGPLTNITQKPTSRLGGGRSHPRPECPTDTSSHKNSNGDARQGQVEYLHSPLPTNPGSVNTTRYFREQALRKRPYIDPAWCTQIVSEPLHREVQPDGRVRLWGEVVRPGETTPQFLRVVYIGGRRNHPQCLLRSAVPKGRSMKLHYYPETDSLYIEFKPTPGTETREVVGGLNVDLDDAGEVVGFDIDHASKLVDLSTLETESLPLRNAAAI